MGGKLAELVAILKTVNPDQINNEKKKKKWPINMLAEKKDDRMKPRN